MSIPIRTRNYVVAVIEDRNPAVTNQIVRVGANQTIGFGNLAVNPARSATPGHRPASVIPNRTKDKKIAVTESDHATITYIIIRARANKAIASGHKSGYSGGAVFPGHGSPTAVPRKTLNHVASVT